MRLNSIQENVLSQLDSYLPNCTVEFVNQGDTGGELIALKKGDTRLLLASEITLERVWFEMSSRKIRLGVLHDDFSDEISGTVLRHDNQTLLLINLPNMLEMLDPEGNNKLKDWILGEIDN